MKKAKNRGADTAATLAVSRLPLGAHHNLLSHSRAARPNSRTSQTSAVTHDTSSSHISDKENTNSTTTSEKNNKKATSAEESQTPESETMMSIAEAKLERQNKRIQEAEAALTAPLPVEKERQPSRKGKWKPFDYTTGSTSATPTEGPDLLHLNPFRDSSRASSLNRSLSSLSQRTTNTAISDSERHDSTGGGFQLYTRKSRRTAEQLGVYEQKPPEKQSTVEATFDRREIYEVFGNALPGPEFIEQNVGYKNGQLQFAQHPNGDVSAHQWSSGRYMWENIGQFSNIRKKVEGQLAADRLKSETAYQTVQRNTMAYFRTIAKQREAAVMGTTFGAKEIQALMPDLRLVQEVPTAPKSMRPMSVEPQEALPQENESVSQPITSVPAIRSQSRTLQPSAPAFKFGSTGHSPYGPVLPVRPVTLYAAKQYISQPSVMMYRPYAGNEFIPANNQRYDDPFYSSTAPHTTQDTVQHQSPATKPGGVTYNSFGAPVASDDYSQPPNPITTFTPPQRLPEVSRRSGNETSAISAPAPPLQKAVTPLTSVTRTAMRNQLIKLGDQAKERSISQSSFRTVMYDPLRNEEFTPSKTANEAANSQFNSPALDRSKRKDSADLQISPRTTVGPIVSRAPIVPALPLTRGRLGASTLEDKIHSKPAAIVAPIGTPASTQKATPQTLAAPFFSADDEQGSVTKRKPRQKALNEWWNSGNRFSRQEEFCRRVEDAWLRGPETTPTRPSATSGMRMTVAGGNPSSTTFSNPHPVSMTRLLVPVLENLSSYVQGPVEKRRDYFSQWSKPAEWCIDRSPDGNQSFYDKSWGQPPARIGRDPRYQPVTDRFTMENLRFGAFSSPQRGGNMANLVVGAGLDRRFAFQPTRM